MTKIPASAAEAAIFIEKLAKAEGKTLHAYCRERGIHSSQINVWRKRNKGYDGAVFFRLIQKI